MRKIILFILIFTPYIPSTSFHREIVIEYYDTFPEIEIKMNPVKQHSEFLNEIGFRESSNRYHVVNTLGYMGKYQFGMSTLETLRINTTKEKFLNSPWLQEYAMKKLLKRNKRILNNIILEYSGTVIDSTTITESGILAAAHLGGAGSVIDYFQDDVNKKDSYGTSVANYMKNFSGYQLTIN